MAVMWRDIDANATVHCGTVCLQIVEDGGVKNGTYVVQINILSFILLRTKLT